MKQNAIKQCIPVMYKIWIVVNNFCYFSVPKSCQTICNPMDCSMLNLPVLHPLLELAHTHVFWVIDAIQQFHPLSPLSPPINLSQHQGLFKSVDTSHQVAKVLELQHQALN